MATAVADRLVMDLHGRGGDPYVVRDRCCGAALRLRYGRSRERVHRGGQGRSKVRVGEIAPIVAGLEEDKNRADPDTGDRQRPRVRRRAAADSRERHGMDGGLDLGTGEDKRRRAACRQRVVKHLPSLLHSRSGRQNLTYVRDRPAFNEPRCLVAPALRIRR